MLISLRRLPRISSALIPTVTTHKSHNGRQVVPESQDQVLVMQTEVSTARPQAAAGMWSRWWLQDTLHHDASLLRQPPQRGVKPTFDSPQAGGETSVLRHPPVGTPTLVSGYTCCQGLGPPSQSSAPSAPVSQDSESWD